ncbi:Protein kinase domain-containing protein [Cladophialophora immunda]|nr:Protein kinase domain-containing protein [Cladophialophora immunda]
MPVQGKRLDGGPFETLDFGELDDFVIGYKPRVWEERQVPGDFDPIWYADRHGRGAFGREAEDEAFLRRRLYFEENVKDDVEWGPVRLLGRGGYGIVGLWQKRDNKNQTIDEVVLKQTAYNSNETRVSAIELDPRAYPRHLIEAAIHKDINTQHPGVSPHLRQYKFIYEDRIHQQGRYRFYLEYCPHGSLYQLGRLYRCWDTYLPEVFVWHVFYSLAKACEALRDSPPADSRAIKEEYFELGLENVFCLHLDLKPENVLLGYPHEGQEYPSALLNDYGISMYTICSDKFPGINPGEMWWRGTHSHRPTEQCHFGVNWEIPPEGGWIRNQDTIKRNVDWHGAADKREEDNDGKSDENGNDKPPGDVIFDHTMNIYGVGHTVFDLVTLRSSTKHLVKIRAKSLKRFQQNGNHQISHVSTKKPGVYSSRSAT